MPIRGHSGVQGGAEVGCVPWLEEDQGKRFEDLWSFKLPTFRGLSAGEMVAAAYRHEIDVFWMVGGNFLETLPDPAAAAQALENVRTRIHQDVLLSSMMLLCPKDTVIIFPATTRYESPGGGTETSTERRIIFCPEIPGRRIGSSKPEWEVFSEVAARVVPELADKVRCNSSQGIRDQIGKTISLYAGIEGVSKEGENFQWGGPRLFAEGEFATPEGKAHFSVVSPRERRAAKDMFYVSTRRGKQFNSMVQRATDPLTGASRNDIFISKEDVQRLGVENGQFIRLVSSVGTYVGRAKIDEIKPGNLEVHWPEGNCLLSREEMDFASREPDYNAIVKVVKANGTVAT